jgi:hypothetical protein
MTTFSIESISLAEGLGEELGQGSEDDALKWLQGIGTGAAGGAATGAVAGPWGALVGGLVGAGLGAVQTAQQQRSQQQAQRRTSTRRPATPPPRAVVPSGPPPSAATSSTFASAPVPAAAPIAAAPAAAPTQAPAAGAPTADMLQQVVPLLLQVVQSLQTQRTEAVAAEGSLPSYAEMAGLDLVSEVVGHQHTTGHASGHAGHFGSPHDREANHRARPWEAMPYGEAPPQPEHDALDESIDHELEVALGALSQIRALITEGSGVMRTESIPFPYGVPR